MGLDVRRRERLREVRGGCAHAGASCCRRAWGRRDPPRTQDEAARLHRRAGRPVQSCDAERERIRGACDAAVTITRGAGGTAGMEGLWLHASAFLPVETTETAASDDTAAASTRPPGGVVRCMPVRTRGVLRARSRSASRRARSASRCSRAASRSASSRSRWASRRASRRSCSASRSASRRSCSASRRASSRSRSASRRASCCSRRASRSASSRSASASRRASSWLRRASRSAS
jgi:hypothetical protein